MTSVTEIITYPDGSPAVGVPVRYMLVGATRAFVSADDETVLSAQPVIQTDALGEYTIDVPGNSTLLPAGTRWRREVDGFGDLGRMRDDLIVPASGGPYVVEDILAGPLPPVGQSSLDLHAADIDLHGGGQELFYDSKADVFFQTTSQAPVPVTGWSASGTVPDRPFELCAVATVLAGDIVVSASSRTSNVVTLTVPAGHGFVAGDPIVVRLSDVTFNGSFVVQSVTATTVLYAQTAANDADGGTGVVGSPLAGQQLIGAMLGLYADLPVSAAARTSNVVTVTVPEGHGVQVGSPVIVDLTDNTYDGSFQVTAVTDTTVSWAQVSADDADGGTGTLSVQIGPTHEQRGVGMLLQPRVRIPSPFWAPDAGLAYTLAPRARSLSAAQGITVLVGPFFGASAFGWLNGVTC